MRGKDHIRRGFAVPGIRIEIGAQQACGLLADELAAQYDVVMATEIGGGIVPLEAEQRQAREAAGRLACLLAARADTVIEMFCGIATVLKGEMPC